jgi:hypothetical protein
MGYATGDAHWCCSHSVAVNAFGLLFMLLVFWGATVQNRGYNPSGVWSFAEMGSCQEGAFSQNVCCLMVPVMAASDYHR